MTQEIYEFPCGCKFPIDGAIAPFHGHPSIIYNVEQAPLDCPITWEMISSGRTKGVFQLESSLGKAWAKRLKPENIEHLAALTALLRPGCLRSRDERGISMTELYCRRKNGEEEVVIDIEAVKDILEKTFDVIVYQEQFMHISQIVAGFDLVEVDKLRKAAGKKDAKAMTEVGELFVEKADKLGVITREEAERLFANISKSARYAFNRCTSFDTKIFRASRGRNSSWAPFTVEEMYHIRHDPAYAYATGHHDLYKKWKRLGNYGKSLSLCDDGRLRPNTITDIQPAGVVLVYKITLENGATIRVTGNHKFPTSAGEMTVDEMMKGERFREVSLFTRGEYEKCTKKYNLSNATNTTRATAVGLSGQGTHGERNRWFTNGSFTKFEKFRESTPDECFDCGAFDCRIETHHINGDRTNSEPDNLMKLCVSCHKIREYAAGRVKRGEKGYPTVPVHIASIRPDGECMTYNVTMGAPNHTFVVESGIVTSNSHSVSYAIDAYWTAHAKAHFPIYFFTAYLYYAKEKQKPLEEIRALINEAKLFNIEVLPPRFSDLHKNFTTDGVEIRFGLADVKGIGERTIDNLKAAIPETESALGKTHTEWTWFEFLMYFSEHVDATAIKRMIEVGALRNFRLSRLRLLAEYSAWKNLTNREQELVADLHTDTIVKVSEEKLAKFPPNLPYEIEGGEATIVVDKGRKVTNLEEAIASLLTRIVGYTQSAKPEPRYAVSKARRSKVESILKDLQHPASPLEDKAYWIAKKEEEALGVAITCTPMDDVSEAHANITCRDLEQGKRKPQMIIVVQIQEVREIAIKNGKSKGQMMAYMQVADSTGSFDNVVIFGENWKKYSNVLSRDKTVAALQGSPDKSRGSFVVEKVLEI